MIENNVQVCAVLRHFKSDSKYLAFKDESWIEELEDDDKRQLGKELENFNCYPYDNHLLIRWYYVGRAKGLTVLPDNTSMFFSPWFTSLRLFKTGGLLMPMCFYQYRGQWREMALHGKDNYCIGYGARMGSNLYEMNTADTEPFQTFKTALAPYLRFLNLGVIPYRKPPKLSHDIDMRCLFATHLLLTKSQEGDNHFLLFDLVLAYTNGLESLYLLQSDRMKAINLAARVAVVLGQNEQDENRLRCIVTQFYKIRNSIVHGSLLDKEQDQFVQQNIWTYQDILRKSILAFLDLNQQSPSKEVIVGQLQTAIPRPNAQRSIRESLSLLKLAR